MIITDIKREKRHLVRVSFSDCREILIDTDVCTANCLKVGSEIKEEQLEDIVYQSDYERAKSRALWYLDRNALTEKALYDKLVKSGFSQKAAAAVLQRLCELGLIDDCRYAACYAEQCIGANLSTRDTYFKLLNRGVPKEIAKDALGALEPDERAQIRAVLEKKYRLKLEDPQNTQKVYAALIRKGFSFAAVRDVLKEYNEELQYASEEF